MPRGARPPAGDAGGPPLGALLRHYGGAGEPLACAPVAQGLLNRGYRLTTTRGTYFLKHHLDGDRDAITRQHRAIRRLQALGVPVAPPVEGKDGDTVAVVGGDCYALHPWIDGRHRDGAQLTARASRSLGALLGLVHTCLDRVMRAGDHASRPPAPARDEGPGAVGPEGGRPDSGGPAPR
ncbi:phosphotransferase, partial [Streptomyces fuscigenes]|uniref:phosphotransferase n=1 Tax=Streptomyces fuscigenes TaxID=1528880 RepID=UPI001F3E793C